MTYEGKNNRTILAQRTKEYIEIKKEKAIVVLLYCQRKIGEMCKIKNIFKSKKRAKTIGA